MKGLRAKEKAIEGRRKKGIGLLLQTAEMKEGAMLEFATEKVTEHVTRIFAFSTELMYLVEGKERAALIDTGTGIGSLRACVERLTDKPVIVLLTHGHVDHAMGASEFEEVYMNHADDYIYNQHCSLEFRKGGIDMSPVQDQITDEDFVPYVSCDTFHDMKDKDSFDLGGITIEIYDCPGHTRGSVVMLIKEERILLTGDACNYMTFMFDDYSTSIAEYRDTLIALKEKVAGKYDTVLLSHGDGKGHREMLEDVIKVCDDIMAGNTDDVPFVFRGMKGLIAKRIAADGSRTDGGKGNIVYNKDKIYAGR
jgi:glyoxylase-like metal-dependent hydrolase (beta-lactamase superfamily II)